MNRITIISVSLIVVLTSIFYIWIPALDTQSNNETGKSIPLEVSGILNKSCPGCHTEPGNIKALAQINLLKWNDYSPEIQAAKAIAICNFVTEKQKEADKLKKTLPENAPTEAEIKTICDWAQSLQNTKK